MGDFETTVYTGQEYTEVWAAACAEFYTEDVEIFHSLREIFDHLVGLDSHVTIYFHNLKFDGSFWLPFLLDEMKYEQAYIPIDEERVTWKDTKKMSNGSFRYSISDNGIWYNIIIKVKDKFIEIRDSLKLIPFSVAEIGESFKTKHRKLEMVYEGFRYAGCEITDKEKHYIANDVLVVKEALEIMFSEGHNRITIGSCCLAEYRSICKTSLKLPMTYDEMFPDVYSIKLTGDIPNVGEWIRKSYRGGWCYCVKGKEGKKYTSGLTADVNSLYPSMMHSDSGNRYPVGKPCFWSGDFIPEEAKGSDKYYFIKIKTRFYLKQNYLPFIQIKNSFMYQGTECLETSDILVTDKYGKEYYVSQYKGPDGKMKDTRMEFTLTMTDWELMKEHYELVDCEILGGCWFYALVGIFDEYIDKYKEKKQNSTGGLRTLAKLFLNNLYGKMASSPDSSFKIVFKKPDGSLGFKLVEEYDKKPGYIPVGSAITSYSRNFTIRAAQKNYHGKDRRGFIYADTDSIHCDLKPEELKEIPIHESNFCNWKIESLWDEAFFTRQKTYIEHVTHVDLRPVNNPYYKVTCAGMPERCKDLFIQSIEGADGLREYSREELEFLFDEEGNRLYRTLDDFNIGLRVFGKLIPKRIKGGVVLIEDFYTMR